MSEQNSPSLSKSDIWITCESYAEFLGVWSLVLLVIAAFPKKRHILGALECNVRGNRWIHFCAGIAIGFVYDPAFGIEGTVLSCHVLTCMTVGIIIWDDDTIPAPQTLSTLMPVTVKEYQVEIEPIIG